MNKILDELEKINSEDKVAIENNKIVKDSILLLNAPSEDNSLLREFGIDHQIKHVEGITNLSNRQRAMSEMYNTESYTGKQIKDLCCKYYLKLLPISFFRGNIPVELSAKLKEFAENNKVILTGNSENFFILAPYDQFATDRFNDNDAVERASKINSTPILFYRENARYELAETEHVFSKVYSWGDTNFSWFRRFLFLFNCDDCIETVSPIVRTVFMTLWLFVGLLFGIAWGFVYFPVICFVMAAITLYSNTYFKITPDQLWNRSNEKHNSR